MDEQEQGKSFVTTETSITREQFEQWLDERSAKEKRNPNLRRKRLRSDSDWFAKMRRYSSRNPPEFRRQETLLKDLRGCASREIDRAVFEVREVDLEDIEVQLRGRIASIKSILWYQNLPGHEYYADFRLSREEFEKAIWEEQWPSLNDRLSKACTRLKNEISSRLGNNLKTLREACGLSQDGLCEKASIPSKRRVAEYESGDKRPKPGRLKNFANVFSKELAIEPPRLVYGVFR